MGVGLIIGCCTTYTRPNRCFRRDVARSAIAALRCHVCEYNQNDTRYKTLDVDDEPWLMGIYPRIVNDG